MEIKLNLNNFVKFKLTELGKDIYYHRYDDINSLYPEIGLKPSYPHLDENGYAKMQLWDFMYVYGKHMAVGGPNVVENSELLYLEE